MVARLQAAEDENHSDRKNYHGHNHADDAKDSHSNYLSLQPGLMQRA